MTTIAQSGPRTGCPAARRARDRALRLLVCTALSACAAGRPAGRADDATPRPTAHDLLADVKPPAGFGATIFATSAQANYPVFVAATPAGVLFVSSDGNGSLGRDPHRGRVLRLRDTDADGTADEVLPFVADLDAPRGLLWVDDRLLVLHPPHISSFRDADGDGVAEEREVLVRGIAFDYKKRPADHTSNGLTLGIDGWVYAAIGDFGFMDAVGADGRHLQLRGGGLIRFRPDGSGLERFARGTRNTLEAAVGPLLDMIARDNSNDGGGWNVRLHAFTGLEDHGYPRRFRRFADEIVAPLADCGGGSGTGGCWIDEPWMPARYNDAAFTCDWGKNEIYRHAVSARGAGCEVTQETFLGLTRATDLDVDAVGHVYAASWRKGGFSWSGPDVGFVVRLTPEGATPRAIPDLAAAPPGSLVDQLGGPSHRLRLAAQRALLARGLVDDVAPELERLAADVQARPAGRVAAVFTLALGRRERSAATLAALAADPTIAAWAVRALGDLAADGPAVPGDVVHAALASAAARTRKEAVVAAVRSGAGAPLARVLACTADADPIVAHTAVEGLVQLSATREADVIAVCTSALDDPATVPAVHRAAARVLGEIHAPAAAAAVIDRLARAPDATRRADLVWAAARLWQEEAPWKEESWGTRPDTRGPYYAPRRWSASDRLQEALLQAVQAAPPSELADLARTLGLHRLPVDTTVTTLAGRADATAALVTFLDVTEAAPPGVAIAPIATLGADTTVPTALRLAALRVLARSPSVAALEPLCTAAIALETGTATPAEKAAGLQLARENAAVTTDLTAVDALASRGPAHATLADEMLLTVAGSSSAKSGIRGAAAARLQARWQGSAEGRLALVAASLRTRSTVLATSLVAAADQPDDLRLRAAAGAAVKALGINVAAVRDISSDTGPRVGERPVEEVLKLVDARRGDRAIGMELFVAKKCVSCHAAGVDSAGLGPSLANAAGIYNRRQLGEAVLQPGKTIAQGFATTALLLDDGRPLLGFVTSEGAEVLTLRDGQGVEHQVDKRSIEERTKLTTSMMPEGLVSDLTVGQFASLVDFIESIGR